MFLYLTIAFLSICRILICLKKGFELTRDFVDGECYSEYDENSHLPAHFLLFIVFNTQPELPC